MPSADRRIPAQADRLESLAAGGGRKQRRRQRAAVSGGEGGGRWRRWFDGDLASATQISACGTRSSGVALGLTKRWFKTGALWAGLGWLGRRAQVIESAANTGEKRPADTLLQCGARHCASRDGSDGIAAHGTVSRLFVNPGVVCRAPTSKARCSCSQPPLAGHRPGAPLGIYIASEPIRRDCWRIRQAKTTTMQLQCGARPSLGLRPLAARPQAALHAVTRLQSAAQPPRQLRTAQVSGGWRWCAWAGAVTAALAPAAPLFPWAPVTACHVCLCLTHRAAGAGTAAAPAASAAAGAAASRGGVGGSGQRACGGGSSG